MIEIGPPWSRFKSFSTDGEGIKDAVLDTNSRQNI
jgi:hypothetical protein